MSAMHQREHEAINAREYPGTRQLCATCDEPTERCEEDSIYADDDGEIGPLCVECWHQRPEYLLARLFRHWDMFAQDYGNNRFMHFGSKRYADMHGGDEPTVAVRLTEDPDGEYHGWLETGDDTPSMIWPSRAQLTMCFAYGIQVEIDKGRGVELRLRCESLPNVDVDAPPSEGGSPEAKSTTK